MCVVNSITVRLKKNIERLREKKDTELKTGLPAAISAVSIRRQREAKYGSNLVENREQNDVAEVWHPAGAAKQRSEPVVPLSRQLHERHGHAQPNILKKTSGRQVPSCI